MKITLGSDHAGFLMKQDLVNFVKELGHTALDVGTDSNKSVDYPDFALAVAQAVSKGEAERGIIVCGTGIGSTIAANKVLGIRAALCHSEYTARMSREHNDANVLCLGERVINQETARVMVKVWLTTPFAGDRHLRRLEKIKKFEEKK